MYYLYRHIRLDKNEVFYVGIGKLRTKYASTHRGLYSRAYQKSKSRNAYWKNIVKSTKYDVEIVYETSSMREIIAKEKEFIKLYLPTLCNMTSGGLGISSYNHSEETKRKIGKHFKGKKLSEEHKKKVNLKKLKPFRIFNEQESFTFNSLTEAAIFLGDKSYIANLSACARGRRHKVKGYKCEYITEVTELRDKELAG